MVLSYACLKTLKLLTVPNILSKVTVLREARLGIEAERSCFFVFRFHLAPFRNRFG